MTWHAFLWVSVFVPGGFAWWSGRRLVRQPDDAALAERLLARHEATQQVALLSCLSLAFAAGRYYWFAVLGLLLGTWIGDYPSRRRLLEERWTLPTCVLWQVRFHIAWLGFWFALLLAPTVIQAAGTWRWPVAAVLALLLGLWSHRCTAVFVWLVRARPMPWPAAAWDAISARSRVPRPRLFRMPVPGGRFVNAFAFPSTGVPSVLVTDPALELLSPREQAAVFAHEVSHLERHDARRRRRAAAVSYGLVVLATLGAALALGRLPAGSYASVWSLALLLGLAWRASRQKAHETESDRRALALCRDAEALIGGLTKLTAAGRLPRRSSVEVERRAPHPSLARRLHAIRRAAGIVPVPGPLEDALVVPTLRPGQYVTLDRDRVWVNDVRYPAQKIPRFLRRTAGSAWAFAYADLVELRIDASWWGGTALVARDRTGRSRAVAIPPEPVAALQQRLDAIEPRLSQDVLLAEPPPLVGRLASLGLWLVSVPTLLALGLVTGLVGMIRPGAAALGAVAGVAGVSVLVRLVDLDVEPVGPWTFTYTAGSVLLAAVAAWLAAQPRTFNPRAADYLPVVGAVGIIVIATWGPFTAELVRTGAPAAVFRHTMSGAPLLWAAPAALAGALLTAPSRRVRWWGWGLLAVAVLGGGGTKVVDRLATPRPLDVATDAQPLVLAARLELPLRVGVLRVSPLGSRVAVSTRDPKRPADRFLVLALGGGQSRVEARDLVFTDETHALVVVDRDERSVLEHHELDGAADAPPEWSVSLPATAGTTIASFAGPAWAVTGYDAATEELLSVTGRIGNAWIRTERWAFDASEWIESETIGVGPDGRGVRAVSEPTALARLRWGAWIYGGGFRRQSRVWRLDAGRQALLGIWPAAAGCHVVAGRPRDVVCIGEQASRTLVWRFGLASGPTPPLVVREVARRSGISPDGRFVALWGADAVVLLDLDRGRAMRRPLPPQSGVPSQLVPLADRLVTLVRRPRSTPAVEVYDIRW